MYKNTITILCMLYCVSFAVAGFNFGNIINHVNQELGNYMLPRLNAVRAHVKPTPVIPLANLTWDATLAQSAGRWASKCLTDDYSDDYYSGKVGESITTVPLAQVLDVNHGLLSWANQNTTYNLKDNACLDGFDCAAYTQLVWNRTQKVGCATNLCKGNAVLVCQFYPPGNFPGIAPFHSDHKQQIITRLDGQDNATASTATARNGGGYHHGKRGEFGDYTCTVDYNDAEYYGYCQSKDQCFNSNQNVVGWWGDGICDGYDSSTTVCCTYNDDQPGNGASSSGSNTDGSNSDSSSTSGSSSGSNTDGSDTNTDGSNTDASTTDGGSSASTTSTSTTSGSVTGPVSPTTNAATTAAPAPTTAPTGNRLQFPTSQDWRSVQAVTTVKNQQQCGSCWDFSTTACAESAWAIFTGGQQIDMAEQTILDCTDHSDGYNTCNGGYPGSAASYFVSKGGVTESQDPYESQVGTCPSLSYTYSFTTSGQVSPWKTKDDILNALAKYGPVVVMVDADDSWQSYQKGVISKSTSTNINHAVLLVGYDSANDAWIIKNSWSPGWGENGYIRIARTGDFAMTMYSATYVLKTK